MARSFLYRNWKYAPRGDFESLCSICGVACARFRLRKKADQLYYCPDCQRGRDAVTLSRLNAQYHPVYRRVPLDGGGFDDRGPYIDVDSYPLELISPTNGQLCATGLPVSVVAIVRPESTATVQLGSGPMVAMTIDGTTATATITPTVADIGDSVQVTVRTTHGILIATIRVVEYVVELVSPELGQLCPVGLPIGVVAVVLPGSTATVQLGASAPVAMTVVGTSATATLTPVAGNVGTAVTVTLVSGSTTLTTTVDVEASIDLWANASNAASYTATSTALTSIINLISGVAASTVVGSPKILTDPRINKPAFYFDLTSYIMGNEAAVLATSNGTDQPFTYILVCASSLATASFAAFGAALSTNIGSAKEIGQSGGTWYTQLLGNPAGPARSVLTEPVTAGISVVVFHSANSLTVATGVNGGAESSGTMATAGVIASNRFAYGARPSSSPSLQWSGYIYELIKCGPNKSAAQIAAMMDRCKRFWRALAPQVVFIGDSITTAQLVTNGGMPTLLTNAVVAAGGVCDTDGPLATGQPIPIRHSASSGNTPTDMSTRVKDAALGLGSRGGGTGSSGYYSRCKLVCVMAGTNPTGAGTNAQKAVQTATDYATLLNDIAVRLAQGGTGWRIAVTTIPTQGASDYPNLFNALLTAVWNAFDAAHPANTLLRWDAFNALGPYDPIYYFNIVHPSDAGYVKMCNDPTRGLFQAVVPFLMTLQPST